MLEDGRHYFIVEVGSERGAEVLAESRTDAGTATDEGAARRPRVERAAAQMGRELETDGIKELLYRNYEHPRWDEVAERCLTCGNCTMVCPTCFCTTVEDATDLDRRARPSASGSGTRASPWTSPTCTAAASAPRRARATGSG